MVENARACPQLVCRNIIDIRLTICLCMSTVIINIKSNRNADISGCQCDGRGAVHGKDMCYGVCKYKSSINFVLGGWISYIAYFVECGSAFLARTSITDAFITVVYERIAQCSCMSSRSECTRFCRLCELIEWSVRLLPFTCRRLLYSLVPRLERFTRHRCIPYSFITPSPLYSNP